MNPLKDIIVKHLPFILKHKLVLEFGCGLGEDAIALVKRGFSVEVVDRSMQCITHIRALRSKLQLEHLITSCINIQDFAFTKKYGTIIAMRALHYLKKEERNLIISRMQQNTAPNGIHILALFTERGDLHSHEDLKFGSLEEFKSYYKNWHILLASKEMIPLKTLDEHGEERQHEVLFFVAQNKESEHKQKDKQTTSGEQQ